MLFPSWLLLFGIGINKILMKCIININILLVVFFFSPLESIFPILINAVQVLHSTKSNNTQFGELSVCWDWLHQHYMQTIDFV